jgi:primosomal protein N''
VEDFIEAINDEYLEKKIELSGKQQEVYEKIKRETKPTLLKGVTGSGKTEIYINFAIEELKNGKNVLFMVPEIAISKQLQNRLKKVFGERLLTFHSKQTITEKERINKILHLTDCAKNKAVVVLGTRSALFLPYNNIGLIIIDEEHDSSYKQSEPAPRYHARDAAIMLSNILKSKVLMGSATPSFESEYNCNIKRFAKVELNEKYFGAIAPEVDVIDTIWAYKSHQMVGNFSQKLINEIKKSLANGYQVLIFKNRRSYSPIVECTECGTIPKCPHCNVYLSFHKYDYTLRCHYCSYTTSFTGYCQKCGTASLKYKGAGTEKLEEELSKIIPDAVIARYDADIAKSKKQEDQIIKDFSQGKINILIGTQMISKGFDFEKLQLVAIIQADTILGIQDFRGDEKALQLFNQLMGRTGRRNIRGKIIIQTNQKDHPIFSHLKANTPTNFKNFLPDNNYTFNLLNERKEFLFSPFVRMIKLTVKHKDVAKLEEICKEVLSKLSGSKNINYLELTGPFQPVINFLKGEHLMCFYLKLAKDKQLTKNKEEFVNCLKEIKGYQSFIIDVDPL